MTQVSRIHSPGIITVLNLMGLSIHMPGECMRREQSCIGILLRLFNNGRIHFPSFPQPVEHAVLTPCPLNTNSSGLGTNTISTPKSRSLIIYNIGNQRMSVGLLSLTEQEEGAYLYPIVSG